MTAPQTVYTVCHDEGKTPRLVPYGEIARVLHTQDHAGMLGYRFPVHRVRFVGRRKDRWVVRLRGRWVLFEERRPLRRRKHTYDLGWGGSRYRTPMNHLSPRRKGR